MPNVPELDNLNEVDAPQSPLLNINTPLTEAMGLGEPEEPQPQSQVNVVPWESHRYHGSKGKNLIKNTSASPTY